MRIAGRTSWQVSSGDDTSLIVALYVRDVAGLRPGTEPLLPPLHPGVAVQALPEGVDAERASAQWEQWWARRNPEPSVRSPFRLLLFDPPDFAALGAWPDLRALLLEHHDAAARWSGAVRRRHHEQFVARMRRRGGDLRIDRIVRRQEVRLGRASVPFTFTITELPLEGERGWVVSPDEVIVTFDLLERTAAAEAFLDPVISALV